LDPQLFKKQNSPILEYWNERILEVRLKLSRGNLTVLALYAPEGHEEDNDEFYKQLQDIIIN
jgi:hypothetical protein